MWMQNNSNLVQNGNLTITMTGATRVMIGVRLEQTCTWKQAGRFELTQITATEYTGAPSPLTLNRRCRRHRRRRCRLWLTIAVVRGLAWGPPQVCCSVVRGSRTVR
jgi:hypothetical protein